MTICQHRPRPEQIGGGPRPAEELVEALKQDVARRSGSVSPMAEGTAEQASFVVNGSQRGWGTGFPGRPLQTIVQSLCANPIVVIDQGADLRLGRGLFTGPMLGWLVERKIAPRIPVFDKAGRSDGTWARADFEWGAGHDQYICLEGHKLKRFRRSYSDPHRGLSAKGTGRSRGLKEVWQVCTSKANAALTQISARSPARNMRTRGKSPGALRRPTNT
mgnify:CR=1 FL=1